MKLPLGLGDVDLTDWVGGLMSGFISGGAAAVTASFAVANKDPAHYGVGTGNFLQLVCEVFIVSGTLGAMAFLRQKPLPEVHKTVVTERIVEQEGKPMKTETTTQTTVIGQAPK